MSAIAGKDWKVLLVDDDRQALRIYGSILEESGRRVVTAESGREARNAVSESGGFGLAVVDLKLPDESGLDLFRWLRQKEPQLPVIFLTGHGTVETAVSALREGAFHYLTKPPDIEQLLALVRSALERRALERENENLRTRVRTAGEPGELIGRSWSMLDIRQWIKVAGPVGSALLIRGESGTGKELAARAVHEAGPRAGGPFVSVNCGALPAQLLESELFGHERGAFTGAVTAKPGLFEAADGGTIFLDELGECPPELQVRLLRVLQEKEFQRVGGTKSIVSDFRLVAATNADLEEEVKEGRFREDLYYRVNVLSFAMPPLRERRDDIPGLASFFLEKFAHREGRDVRAMTDEAMELLVAHDWPGNVRELQNAIERAVVVCEGEVFGAEDLPPHLRRRGGNGASAGSGEILSGDCSLAEIEKTAMEAALRRHGGNKSRAARTLGISRKLLYARIREYEL
jgi:DNA-binding NtrC family response regulator